MKRHSSLTSAAFSLVSPAGLSFSSFSSEVSFNLSTASGGRMRESEHACLWKSTGSAPGCSCHGNSIEYSIFFFFFSSLIVPLHTGVTEKQRWTKQQGRKMRGPKMRRLERQNDQGWTEPTEQIRNDKREGISWCGTATQNKCQAAPRLVSGGGAAHRDGGAVWSRDAGRCC